MSQNPVRFRVPEKCPFCAGLGSIVIETTIKGSTADMKWCCRACHRDWAITVAEQVERRSGRPDRRAMPRKDRRRRET